MKKIGKYDKQYHPKKGTETPYNMGGTGIKYQRKAANGGKRVSKGGSF